MKVKRIMDISREICPQMVLWPGDPVFEIKRDASIEKGDGCNLSSVNMGLHTGTHIDAPYHFIEEGKTVENLELDQFMGFAKVFEATSQRSISYEDIREWDICPGDVVFFKTHNSLMGDSQGFDKDFVYLEASAAQVLVDKGVKTVGIDYLSVDAFDSKEKVAHHILLSNGVGIVEGVTLKDVDEGEYFFSCLPLKIQGADGSPVRAVLVEFEG